MFSVVGLLLNSQFLCCSYTTECGLSGPVLGSLALNYCDLFSLSNARSQVYRPILFFRAWGCHGWTSNSSWGLKFSHNLDPPQKFPYTWIRNSEETTSTIRMTASPVQSSTPPGIMVAVLRRWWCCSRHRPLRLAHFTLSPSFFNCVFCCWLHW